MSLTYTDGNNNITKVTNADCSMFAFSHFYTNTKKHLRHILCRLKLINCSHVKLHGLVEPFTNMSNNISPFNYFRNYVKMKFFQFVYINDKQTVTSLKHRICNTNRFYCSKVSIRTAHRTNWTIHIRRAHCAPCIKQFFKTINYTKVR